MRAWWPCFLRLIGMLLVVLPCTAWAQIKSRPMTLDPAEWRGERSEDSSPDQPAGAWYALGLRGQALEITRLSRKASRKPGISRPAKDIPAGAWMVVHFTRESDAFQYLVGRHPNGLVKPTLLTTTWQEQVKLGADPQVTTRWRLATEFQRRSDGQLLAGSMRLVGSLEGESRPTLLFPEAFGSAYTRQELLWVGMLPGASQPSVVLRRQLLTGEEELAVLINGQFAQVMKDPDEPALSFSSGVDESDSTPAPPPAQARALPMVLSEAIRFNFGAESWNRALERAEASPFVQRRIAERQGVLRGETFRVWVEYLPRIQQSDDAGSDSSAHLLWRGKLVMRVNFRGKNSVLMEAAELDTDLEMRLGLTRDGLPAIDMNYVPHYNNSFTRGWLWDESGGRFKRWAEHHSQGC